MARRVDPSLRPRLIAAATALFAERGFGGTSMTDVGESAGVTKGGVYFHFRGKEELFFAVLDHWRTALREALVDREPDASGVAALHAAVADYLRFHFEHPAAGRLLRVLAVELHGRFTAVLREDAREAHRALRARLREAIARGERDGTVFAADPAAAAFLVAAGVHGVLDQWLTSPADAAGFCDAEGLAAGIVGPWSTGAEPRRGGEPADAVEAASREFRPPLNDAGPDRW